MKHVSVSVKIILHAKKIIVKIPAHVLVRILLITADTSLIDCDKIISVMDIVSAKMTDIATNVSINYHTKKV